jgi:hypothetical protein
MPAMVEMASFERIDEWGELKVAARMALILFRPGTLHAAGEAACLVKALAAKTS